MNIVVTRKTEFKPLTKAEINDRILKFPQEERELKRLLILRGEE